MANHASHGALPYPVKGARYTILIPYLDADGDPTDPTTPDTEISKDDGAAADAAEEVASPKNGVAMLTLTGAETDCAILSLAAKAAAGPKTTLMTLFPRVLPVLESGTAQAGAAGSITLASTATKRNLAGCIVKTTGGAGGGGTGGTNNQARVITDYDPITKVATVVPDWETTPDATTTYEILITEMAVLAQDNSALLDMGTARTAGSPTSRQIQLASTAPASLPRHAVIHLTGGTGAGQVGRVVGYNGTTKIADVSAQWDVNPSTDTTYEVFADAPVHVARALLDAGVEYGAVTNDQAPAAGAFSSDLALNDDRPIDRHCYFITGTLRGQRRKVSDFANTNGVVTLATAFIAAPAVGDIFFVA